MGVKGKFLATVCFFVHAHWAPFSLERRSLRSLFALQSSNLKKWKKISFHIFVVSPVTSDKEEKMTVVFNRKQFKILFVTSPNLLFAYNIAPTIRIFSSFFTVTRKEFDSIFASEYVDTLFYQFIKINNLPN